jgi:hypothetical protein
METNKANLELIQEYLGVAVNDSENIERKMGLLNDDCSWYIMLPGILFACKAQLRSFTKMAMGSRSHNADSKVEIRNWFADRENFCVEYYPAAVINRLGITVIENVCLVCHMQDGKFDSIHENVDTSKSSLIGFGLRLLPLIIKIRSFRDRNVMQ